MNICDKHKKIQEKADNIMTYFRYNNFNSATEEDLRDAVNEMVSLADDIYGLTEEANDMANKMEERLQEYYEGIKGLGFERKNNETT